MSLEFKKVDDVLTEETFYTMDKNFTRYSDQIKDTIMDLVYRVEDYDCDKGPRMFDDITAISFALDAMIDTLREYQMSYTALMEKYSNLVKAE